MGTSAAAKGKKAPQLKKLAEDLLASANHANNVAPLLSALSKPKDDESFCVAASGLQGYFLQQVAAGDLDLGRAGSFSEAPEAVYRRWLRAQYKAFRKRLLACLKSPAHSPKTQAAALRCLMEMVRGELPGMFSNELFSDVVLAIVGSRAFGTLLLAPLADLFDCADVRYFTLAALRLAAEGGKGRLEVGGEGSGDDDDDEGEEEAAGPLGQHDIARNAFDMLSRVPPEVEGLGGEALGMLEEEEEPELQSWCGAAESGAIAAAAGSKEGAKQRRKRKRIEAEGGGGAGGKVGGKVGKVRWANGGEQKKAFSEAWLAFLRMPLPEDIYKKVLARLHKNVIPHLASPLLLADFLTDSYNVGGLVGMLALNGLFVLVQEHGLEYPLFYLKLYNLLTPEAFRSRHRKRFFELAALFLTSSHLPAYLAAAFAKRAARLALSAPPGGAMLAVGLCHNLLRRHPGCNVLLDRRQWDTEGGGKDPYDPKEEDPAKCRALESSLWEMETLREHYCPQVSRFVEVLDKDLTDKKATTELNVAPLCEASYASVFEEESTRRLKSCPLAFYKSRLQGLFDPQCHEGALAWKGWELPHVDAPPEEPAKERPAWMESEDEEGEDAGEGEEGGERGEEEEGGEEEGSEGSGEEGEEGRAVDEPSTEEEEEEEAVEEPPRRAFRGAPRGRKAARGRRQR